MCVLILEFRNIKGRKKNTLVTCFKWTTLNVEENTRLRDVRTVDRFDLVLRGHLENVGLLLTQELLASSAHERQAQVSISLKLY